MKPWCEAWLITEKRISHNLVHSLQGIARKCLFFHVFQFLKEKIKHILSKQTLLLKGFILQTPPLFPDSFQLQNNFAANLSVSATANPPLPHTL